MCTYMYFAHVCGPHISLLQVVRRSRSPKRHPLQLRGRGSLTSQKKRSQSRNASLGHGYGPPVLIRAWNWQWKRLVSGQKIRSPWDRCSRTRRPASQTVLPSGTRWILRETGSPSPTPSTTTAASRPPSPSSRWVALCCGGIRHGCSIQYTECVTTGLGLRASLVPRPPLATFSQLWKYVRFSTAVKKLRGEAWVRG